VRVHVALTPAELEGADLHAQTVVVIDVFRAATTVATALSNGCRAIIPALTPDDARARRSFREERSCWQVNAAGSPSRGSTSATRRSSTPPIELRAGWSS
jgi:hypothetical protein